MKTIKLFSIIIACIIVPYFAMAFCLWEIDASKWSIDQRLGTIMIFCVLLSITLVMYPIIHRYTKVE